MAGLRSVSVAVHGVAAPDQIESFLLHGAGQAGQAVADFFRAEAGDQGQTAWFVVWVEDADQSFHLIKIVLGPDLDPDRVMHPPEELHMRPVELAGTLADPKHMGRAVVPIAGG